MRSPARLAFVVAASFALVGCSVGAGDAAPSDQSVPVDASPSPVATAEPTTSSAPEVEQGGTLDPNAATQYFHAFCPTLVLEDALMITAYDELESANLGPARTTTSAAASHAAELMVADWVEWPAATLDARTRLAADLGAYAEALVLADLDASSMSQAVSTSPLRSDDSTELRIAVGLNVDLDVACAGG